MHNNANTQHNCHFFMSHTLSQSLKKHINKDNVPIYPHIISPSISRQNIEKKIKWWIENQHLVLWCGPCSTETGLRNDVWPKPGYKGLIIVL
jgi:hypothetical protein